MLTLQFKVKRNKTKEIVIHLERTAWSHRLKPENNVPCIYGMYFDFARVNFLGRKHLSDH